MATTAGRSTSVPSLTAALNDYIVFGAKNLVSYVGENTYPVHIELRGKNLTDTPIASSTSKAVCITSTGSTTKTCSSSKRNLMHWMNNREQQFRPLSFLKFSCRRASP
jgi:hypothetical protein